MSNITNLAVVRETRRQQETPKSVGKGFTLLHRKIMDVPFYKDPEASHLWVHLLLRANHEQTLVSTDIGDVLCERGEFITGRNTLAFETGLEPDRVKSLLRKYTNLGMITTKSNNRFTVLKVVKYDEYQQFSCPADVQPVSRAKPRTARDGEQECPADVQPVSTDKELLNTNTILSDDSIGISAEKNQGENKTSISCQDIVNAYHEILPEASLVRVLNDTRKNKIRTFWRKAGVVTKQLDGHKFTMQDWRDYLTYVSQNCRWMFEERQNHQRGTTWHKKGFDFFLNDNVYLKVREGEHDDR
ncbi:DNA replication protein [Izhakiella australiensis]|uniref:DNA replication protein n=1 Tax=Izhakiella australiensis TaxID=1926881 RepID=A0A1S8Y722_9GAMM|nr:DNA replication protein [Izhakiella australiensis]OON34638.1 DNA replication protein [Izhakiella australiensis]